MAYSRELRGKVIAAVIAGASLREAGRRFGVNHRTVALWVGGVARAAVENSPRARRKVARREAVIAPAEQNLVDSFLLSMLKGLNAGAEVLSEKAFMRENPKAWNDVLITLMAKAERFVRPESDGVPGAGGESPGKG